MPRNPNLPPERYPELEKQMRLTPQAMLIASFVKWADDQDEAIETSPRGLSEQLERFFGLNREQILAEQEAMQAESRALQEAVEAYTEKRGRPQG